MSDSLSPETPEAPEAAPAPPAEPAVETDSVDSDGVVPKERFNGLQSRYQSDKSAWDAERRAYEAEIERLHRSQEDDGMTETNPEVLEEVRQLRQELVNERLGRVRAEILSEFPEVAPFADLIVGRDADEIRSVAADLAGRVKQLAPAEAGTPPAAEPTGDAPAPAADAPPTAPSFAPPTSANDEVSVDDRVADAVERRSWTDYLAAAADRAELQGAELTVS